MEKLIVCFPGQGAQEPKMALDLYNYSQGVKDLFQRASDICDMDFKNILETYDIKQLSETIITQTTMVLAELSALKVLEEEGYIVDSTAGFSLGELSAYRASGVLSEDDIFKLVKIRGTLMEASANESSDKELAMAAVIGIGKDQIFPLLDNPSFSNVYIANDNSTKQIVISGELSEIDAITPLLKESGARRVLKLRVASAFHSPFMNKAEVKFEKVLKDFTFNNPTNTLYCNVSGKVELDGNRIKSLASEQITHGVQWLTTMKDIKANNVDNLRIVEAGPKKVLTGLFNSEDMVCHPCGTLEDILGLRNK
ncbi:MAG: ACP S-malonyltransferase [Spirochaetaceae bacterium]|nr:ACP S-malonyltransferase [Spirochaetaceae bacterium]